MYFVLAGGATVAVYGGLVFACGSLTICLWLYTYELFKIIYQKFIVIIFNLELIKNLKI